MISENELVPLERFSRIIRFWWIIALTAVLGGVVGLAVHRLKSPVYEAQAVFLASIDFNKIDFMHPPAGTPAPYKLTQYDEDVTLGFVNSAIVQVIPQVAAYAEQQGIPLDASSLVDQASIDRENANWNLRFRDQDPLIAQKITNYWAQSAFTDLQTKQKAGQLPVYLIVDLVSLAQLPTSPTYFQTNVFVFAGGVFGLVIGLVFVLLPVLKIEKKP